MLCLRLIKRHKCRTARIADQEYLGVASLAQKPHPCTKVLDHPLHNQRAVVRDITRVETEQIDARACHWLEQVMAHEVAGRVHHDCGRAITLAMRQRPINSWIAK